jgi:hypothetical protein
MSDFNLSSVSAPPPVSPVGPVETPKPPKAQSDHKPLNPPTFSRGPAVVLSGSLSKPPERQGQEAPSEPANSEPHTSGQHVNRTI